MTAQTVNRRQPGHGLPNPPGLPKTISVLLALAWLTACAGVPDISPPAALIERTAATNEMTQVAAAPAGRTFLTATPFELPFLGSGGRIAFASERDGTLDIYVLDVGTDSMTRLTNDPAGEHGAAWSPDGEAIAFVSDREGSLELVVKYTSSMCRKMN